MKRLLFALVIVGLVSSQASAQEFKAGAQLGEAIVFVAGCAGLQVAYAPDAHISNQPLAVSVQINGCQTLQQVKDALVKILPASFDYRIDSEGRLLINRRISASAPQPVPPAPTAPVDSRRAVVDGILARYPQAYQADGTIGSFNQLLAMQRELSVLNQAPPPPQLNTPVYAGPSYQSSGYYGSFFGNGYVGNGYGFGADYPYVQNQIDNSTWGALKFKKGSEGLMQNIEVYGCDQLLTQADEANNFWDKPVFVPVNCNKLTFRYTSGSDDWEVEMPVMIVPLRMHQVKNITIDKHFFERARQMTVRRKYSMLEQTDGSFKRVPREEDTTGKR